MPVTKKEKMALLERLINRYYEYKTYPLARWDQEIERLLKMMEKLEREV